MTEHDEPTDAGDVATRSTDLGDVLRAWGPIVLGTLAIALLVRLLLFQSYVIPSDSMMPTLVDGDRVVVNRLSYQLGEIERGQVVVFERPPLLDGTDDVIKRIVGLPGETIRLIDNQVYVDGLRVVEPYLFEKDSTRRRGTIPGCAQEAATSDRCVVPDGHVFVLGDNRDGSDDSRAFGPVSIDTIIGRAFIRLWPVTDVGRL